MMDGRGGGGGFIVRGFSEILKRRDGGRIGAVGFFEFLVDGQDCMNRDRADRVAELKGWALVT